MPDTKNSPEYHILEFLNENKNRLNDKITQDDVFNGIKFADRHRFDKDFPTLSPHYIKKRENGIGYHITEDGQARYNDMVRHIDALATKESIDSIKYIGTFIAGAALIMSIVGVFQAKERNAIAREELYMKRQEYLSKIRQGQIVPQNSCRSTDTVKHP